MRYFQSIRVHQGDVKEVWVGRFETNQDADVMEIKLTKDNETDSVDSTKYRGVRTGGQTGRGGEVLESKRAELVDELVIKVITLAIKGTLGVKTTTPLMTASMRMIGIAVSYIRWVEKMETVQDISGCGDNQKVKYSPGLLTSRALPWWNSEVKNRGREAAICRMVAATEPRIIQSAILKARVLTDEAVRNGSLKRSGERRGDGGESSREGNVNGDNKRARTGKVFATITSHFRKEYTGRPRMVNPLNARNSTIAHKACYECGGGDHYKSAYPRLNRASGQGGNHPNQAMAIEGGHGRENNGNLARGRAFMMGAKKARQDRNIVMGTFSLNNHYATMLFDSGANYSFVSTTFVPLLDIEPSSLGFNYEIKIASRQLVEINKVIRDCKLEIEGHTFNIDLITFGYRSFDVIIGIDWLSKHRAEIVYHERVVRIPLPHGDMHRVYRERPEDK
uniref:Reverse transcriptase domain-containing protein n=1 Tax=Tanacetum cinerariifolium TaxID=118510 RepID=A0A6L2M1E4_TANCI|nr:hypothetical protein [Tanacetum cinerariifolium]